MGGFEKFRAAVFFASLLLVLTGKIDVVYPMIKNRIKEYRARFNMKQEDLAAKVFNVSIEEIFTVEE